MKRFRLVKYTEYNGHFRYEVQRRFLFFWVPLLDEGGNRRPFYHEDGAKEYINYRIFKEKKEIIDL